MSLPCTNISSSSVSVYCGKLACNAITFFCISSVIANPPAPSMGSVAADPKSPNVWSTQNVRLITLKFKKNCPYYRELPLKEAN